MLKHILLMLLSIVVLSCSGNKESGNENEGDLELETSSTKNSEEKSTPNEELLEGSAQVTIDGQRYELTEFNRPRSEITWMDDNQISVRLTSLDKERTIQLLLSGNDIYGDKPLDLSLKAADFKKVNHSSLVFSGFKASKDELSSTTLIDGQATIKKLDQNSLDFEYTFEGQGFYRKLSSKLDTLSVSGNIKIQFDNAVDVRQNK